MAYKKSKHTQHRTGKTTRKMATKKTARRSRGSVKRNKHPQTGKTKSY